MRTSRSAFNAVATAAPPAPRLLVQNLGQGPSWTHPPDGGSSLAVLGGCNRRPYGDVPDGLAQGWLADEQQRAAVFKSLSEGSAERLRIADELHWPVPSFIDWLPLLRRLKVV